MELIEIKKRVSEALAKFKEVGSYLLENNLGERCIASRYALHLQAVFPEYSVDVEYNRVGKPPKRLELPEECANYRNEHGDSLVVPDVIVHQRGPSGPNLLVIEFKKTTNPEGVGCDRKRLSAFKSQLGYQFGALVQCETRKGRPATIEVIEWACD